MDERRGNPEKASTVEKLIESMLSRRVVGVAKIEGIPALQLQLMRRKLRDRATLTVTKNRLLIIALERASDQRKGLKELAESAEGQTAVVVSDLNAFMLFKELEATKTKAPARGGETAPEDIVVAAGETPFKPGPIVGDLQKVGIPAAIDKGKVIIRQDKVLVKKGDRIPRDVASILTRLEIYPLIVGLDLRGVYEEGVVFGREVLAVDEGRVRSEIGLAARQAFNLAMFAWIPTPLTAGPMLARVHHQALALATKAGYISRATAPVLLGSAQTEALRLAAVVAKRDSKALDAGVLKRLEGTAADIALGPAKGDESKKEEKKEEAKVSEEEASAGLGALFGLR